MDINDEQRSQELWSEILKNEGVPILGGKDLPDGLVPMAKRLDTLLSDLPDIGAILKARGLKVGSEELEVLEEVLELAQRRNQLEMSTFAISFLALRNEVFERLDLLESDSNLPKPEHED